MLPKTLELSYIYVFLMPWHYRYIPGTPLSRADSINEASDEASSSSSSSADEDTESQFLVVDSVLDIKTKSSSSSSSGAAHVAAASIGHDSETVAEREGVADPATISSQVEQRQKSARRGGGRSTVGCCATK